MRLHISLILLFSEGQAGEAWRPSQKAVLFRLQGVTGQKGIPFKAFTATKLKGSHDDTLKRAQLEYFDYPD